MGSVVTCCGVSEVVPDAGASADLLWLARTVSEHVHQAQDAAPGIKVTILELLLDEEQKRTKFTLSQFDLRDLRFRVSFNMKGTYRQVSEALGPEAALKLLQKADVRSSSERWTDKNLESGMPARKQHVDLPTSSLIPTKEKAQHPSDKLAHCGGKSWEVGVDEYDFPMTATVDLLRTKEEFDVQVTVQRLDAELCSLIMKLVMSPALSKLVVDALKSSLSFSSSPQLV